MWQDYAFALGGLFFAISLIPMLRNDETLVPRTTSVPTASFIALFAVAHFTLGLYWAAATETASALMWFAVATWRSPGE